jgi:hypothetical protein
MSITTRSVAYETVDDRCRQCGKRLCVDLGGGYFGEVDGPTFCLDCGVQPEAIDWVTRAAGLRAAIAVVASGGAG